ncbi:glycoside hydrolase family 3 N-terminal domain-containing protein [Bifidobacterium pluvialisilvae]|uniref:glycoside hydrolase family 3 N-terminal domain-containing protein n=1 Tax=Bifidobacterium pluvialisilvae TaxID=2834436 RepID=UPI001F2EB58F|nr:glycoside hydrolase family 3 N-terminal domain-containing protein [Bifidobacterium pluvialisilvae]
MPLFPSGNNSSGNNSTASPSASTGTSTPSPSRTATKPSTPAASASASTDTGDAATRAKAMATSMSLEEKAGQLIMAPLFAGDSPSTVRSLVVDRHVGSIVLIGNWSGGTASVSQATGTVQGYTTDGVKLLICTDQEGGQVQHLTGTGFDTMPSALEQGQSATATLRKSAAAWGAQLKAAGVNADLAPVADTVQTASRAQNAPIGALDRDFGLDAAGNGGHAAAFIAGMRSSGVMTTVKHFPGLGAVAGNTDFTTEGITDTVTTLGGGQTVGFAEALKAKPEMVMMSLATYRRIDPSQPAAFSKTIIDGYLRSKLGFQGVVTSDSMSAQAVSGIPTKDLGTRFIAAGGDLVCIGDTATVATILQGIIDKAKSDPSFAKAVDRSAQRVLAMKIAAGLA